MQYHDVGTDAFDGFEFVRAEQHDFAARRQFHDQASEDQARAHVEAGEWLIEEDEIGIVHERGRQQDLLAHAFRVVRDGRVPVA